MPKGNETKTVLIPFYIIQEFSLYWQELSRVARNYLLLIARSLPAIAVLKGKQFLSITANY